MEKDRSYYSESGSGLTLSGEEPLQHPEFTLELLKEAKKGDLNTRSINNNRGDNREMDEVSRRTGKKVRELSNMLTGPPKLSS